MTIETDPRGLLLRLKGTDDARIAAVDRRVISSYLQTSENAWQVPAGKREIAFRWDKRGYYAQAVADCELPRDRQLVLRWKADEVTVDFWFEDRQTGQIVGRHYVGSIQIGNRPLLIITY